MPFILSEDEALKGLLQGLKVTDEKNGERPVGVWYGQPDPEIRQQSYPYMTVDLIDVSEAVERAHRGAIDLSYAPEGSNLTKKYSGEWPIPINLDYQISTYARQPRHDRQIISQLLNGPLRMRFATLEIDADNSFRRLDFLGFSKRDTTENGKRLFVNVFNVRISSELIPGEIYELNPVTNVDLFLGWTDITFTQDTAD
jgi:hypothetical protein